MKSWFEELVLVLVYLSPKKRTFRSNIFPHQDGPNWSNQLGKTTVDCGGATAGGGDGATTATATAAASD